MPLFVIDFHSKNISPKLNNALNNGNDSIASKKRAIHWLENCKKIIIKGEEKAVNSSFNKTMIEVEELKEVHS